METICESLQTGVVLARVDFLVAINQEESYLSASSHFALRQ